MLSLNVFNKGFLVGVIFLSTVASANGQVYHYNSEVSSVYKLILKEFTKPLAINYNTKNRAFKKTSFCKPGNHQLDTNNVKPVDSDEWRAFLASIDTSRVLDYKINPSSFGRYRTSSTSRKRKSRITLSSPVFSGDYQLCVCYVDQYNSPLNAAGVLYYLEKTGRGWRVVKTTMTYIS